jgi:hypothetical protein
MKVKELIENLEQFDEDIDVHFVYDYGDHWHTTVAPLVRNVEEGRIHQSDYHRMPKEIEEDNPQFDQAPVVVLLRSTV